MKQKAKKLAKWCKILAICSLLLVGGISPASAHFLDTGYSLYRITYDSVSGPYADYMYNEAVGKWTYYVGTSFTETSNSVNKAYFGTYAYSWWGLYAPSSYPTQYFTIYVNEGPIKAWVNKYYGDNPDYVYRATVGTAVHEFGHAQYLDDLEQGWGNLSIMSYEADPVWIIDPQQHDIDDIYTYRGWS